MDEQTVRAYDQFAQKYDEETSGFWDEFPRTFFDKFCELTNGEVLDIGSGPGRDGLILKQKGLVVTCLDASEAMVALSSAKGLPSVIGDFNKLPFGDERFSGIWSYTSLLHTSKTNIDEPLGEIRRTLKPGGIFGLGLIEGSSEEYRTSDKIPARRLFSYYTKEEVEHLLARHRFSLLYFESFKPGSRNYLNFIARKK